MYSRNVYSGLAGLAFFCLTVTSCQKNAEGTNLSNSSTSSAIAVPATLSEVISGTAGDSVYVMNECGRGRHRDSIARSSLPASVGTYLDANYAGYTYHRAFAVKDSGGTIQSYTVIIYYNDKPVAIQFDSGGGFIKILEQREGPDVGGRGWHEGGRFGCRDGKQKDSIALSALPSSVLNYFSTNYPGDTLIRAYRNLRDSNYVVISRNNGLFATVFNPAAVFVKRIELPAPKGEIVPIEQAALPATVKSYLDASYPAWVFNKAFRVVKSNTVLGFVVIIDANNTRYAVRFDASGNFVAARTIW